MIDDVLALPEHLTHFCFLGLTYIIVGTSC